MSNYSQTTFFTPKDSLPITSPLKVIYGAAYDVEFGNISTAIATKWDNITQNLIVAAPPSGFALTVNGAAGSQIVDLIGATGTGATIKFVDGNTGNRTYTAGVGVSVTGAFEIYDNTANLQRLQLASTGAITVNTPTSGVGLTVSGGAGNVAVSVVGNSTSGSSYGLQVLSGTTSADRNTSFYNQAGTTLYAMVDGVGNLQLSNGAGSGLVGPVYAGIPQNNQSNSYTLVLSDANKHLYHSNSAVGTYTIPANSSVAYPIGTAITFVNPATGGALTIACGDTMYLAGTTSTTGSRTLTSVGLATALKITSTVWIISGSNLT